MILKYQNHVSKLSKYDLEILRYCKAAVSNLDIAISLCEQDICGLNSLLKKHMPLLYTDPTLKTIFSQGCINSVFKRDKSLKELLGPSLYPNYKVNRANSTTSCNKCEI